MRSRRLARSAAVTRGREGSGMARLRAEEAGSIACLLIFRKKNPAKTGYLSENATRFRPSDTLRSEPKLAVFALFLRAVAGLSVNPQPLRAIASPQQARRA